MTPEPLGPVVLAQLCPACRDGVTDAEADIVANALALERPACPVCRSAFPDREAA